MFSGQYGTDYGGLFAATSVTIIPVVIVYLVFQKQMCIRDRSNTMCPAATPIANGS